MSRPEFVYVTYIETTREKLWQALTGSEFTKRYWFNTELRSDWSVGSPLALVMDGQVTDTGTVLECDPPKRLSYTFHHELNEKARKERPSRVTFVLEAYGKLVKLTLTHDDFAPDSVVIDGISKGWPAILASLKSLLERNEPLVIPFEAMEIAAVR
ncbi:SRPBCC family protein [Bradyrhizobium sp. LHD-71]|uniref:SRPBCC family protein n=1 Tax=Bradyrhizobium sp. LHD-71 TaxID=3072141 RepID=UPI00280DEA73|nr:SRPBCC family protein [Bradyrhizobium sp. LHD-71]MDQ8726963.1 SRPBCC family protein [Bradyrhizobium sp. LHD-71]